MITDFRDNDTCDGDVTYFTVLQDGVEVAVLARIHDQKWSVYSLKNPGVPVITGSLHNMINYCTMVRFSK